MAVRATDCRTAVPSTVVYKGTWLREDLSLVVDCTVLTVISAAPILGLNSLSSPMLVFNERLWRCTARLLSSKSRWFCSDVIRRCVVNGLKPRPSCNGKGLIISKHHLTTPELFIEKRNQVCSHWRSKLQFASFFPFCTPRFFVKMYGGSYDADKTEVSEAGVLPCKVIEYT